MYVLLFPSAKPYSPRFSQIPNDLDSDDILTFNITLLLPIRVHRRHENASWHDHMHRCAVLGPDIRRRDRDAHCRYCTFRTFMEVVEKQGTEASVSRRCSLSVFSLLVSIMGRSFRFGMGHQPDGHVFNSSL